MEEFLSLRFSKCHTLFRCPECNCWMPIDKLAEVYPLVYPVHTRDWSNYITEEHRLKMQEVYQ